jgi:hypothetical protein
MMQQNKIFMAGNLTSQTAKNISEQNYIKLCTLVIQYNVTVNIYKMISKLSCEQPLFSCDLLILSYNTHMELQKSQYTSSYS